MIPMIQYVLSYNLPLNITKSTLIDSKNKFKLFNYFLFIRIVVEIQSRSTTVEDRMGDVVWS
ncbi:hypothetical protein BLOT_016032 [Blomia tropicalis]|nr:hypothetical protein BLOT_016032 [Blomia tropicalis]